MDAVTTTTPTMGRRFWDATPTTTSLCHDGGTNDALFLLVFFDTFPQIQLTIRTLIPD